MKDYKAYNDKLFSRWAPIYDGFELLLSGVRKEVTKEIDPTNKVVLDVATGTGSLAIALSDSAKEVVGIDLSSKMLDVARKKTSQSNLSFFQMDASKMDFQDDKFDVATISLGLHDMPPEVRTSVLEETKRVLKKGGKLYILEYDSPTNELLGWCTSNLINTFESKYYMDFLHADLVGYLRPFGFREEKKKSFLFHHLQLLSLSN